MSLTALFWVVLYVSAIVGSFAMPLFGALGYLLEYYMRPELKWWGSALPSLRYNLIVSVVFGVAYVIRRSSLRPMTPAPNPALRWLMAMTVTMAFVTATVAVDRGTSWNWAVQWFKIAVIFPLLLGSVVRTRNAFNLVAAAHMLGAFWWGWDAWQRPKRAAGRLLEIGSGDTLNDNAAAAHLLTVLPFIAVYLLAEKDKRLKAIALIAAPYVINTLILCNSRGAMVGLAVAIASTVFLIRSGHRMKVVGAGIALVATFFLLADDTFIRRQQSTANYEEDGSAQQRLETWRGAARLVEDRPLGAGGRGFHLLSPRYIPEIVALHGGDPRAPHNTWIMVVTEWGIVGLLFFVALNGSTLMMLERLKRRTKLLGQDAMYFYWRALALQLAIIAGLSAGFFSDRLYGESGYWMIGLAYALNRIQLADYAEAKVPEVEAPPAVSPVFAGTWWSRAAVRTR